MSTETAPAGGNAGSSLTVRDNRTGVEYDVPVIDGAVRAADLAKIKAEEDDTGIAV